MPTQHPSLQEGALRSHPTEHNRLRGRKELQQCNPPPTGSPTANTPDDFLLAHLDPSSARRFERVVAAALAGRTVIVVSHRLNTAAHADRIAVVDTGRIIEEGTHQELLAAGGSYAQLWRRSHAHEAV